LVELPTLSTVALVMLIVTMGALGTRRRGAASRR
jgi:hypothetical protein